MYYSANYPDILISNIDINPEISSPNADYSISLAFTSQQRYDYEEYENILKSAIRNFRNSVTYKHYKSYLYDLGINCCQFHPYISNNEDFEMANLEMHHCMLNIFDIANIIMEDSINRYGTITEFDLADLLKIEHTNNRIPIVMLCKNCHQLYHHKYLFIHPEMIFGKWWELIDTYKLGWNRDMCDKVYRYLVQASEEKYPFREENAKRLLELRKEIEDWSKERGVKLSGNDKVYHMEEYDNNEDSRMENHTK